MPDVEPFKVALEVSDVIKESTVEHLDEQFEDLEHLLLLLRDSQLLRDFL